MGLSDRCRGLPLQSRQTEFARLELTPASKLLVLLSPAVYFNLRQISNKQLVFRLEFGLSYILELFWRRYL